MVETAGTPVGRMHDATIGVTMLGQTTPGVTEVSSALYGAGLEPSYFTRTVSGDPRWKGSPNKEPSLGSSITRSQSGQQRDGWNPRDGARPAPRRGAAWVAPGRRAGLRGFLQPGRARARRAIGIASTITTTRRRRWSG